MFNEHEGGTPLEREGKLQQRLHMLKEAREAGYFDEEGTESVDIVHDGINPIDRGPGFPFHGRAELRQPPIMLQHDHDDEPPIPVCGKCAGHGELIMYGDSGDTERCPQCGGTGRAGTRPCFVCDQRGTDIYGTICPICYGRGIEEEPTQ